MNIYISFYLICLLYNEKLNFDTKHFSNPDINVTIFEIPFCELSNPDITVVSDIILDYGNIIIYYQSNFEQLFL